MAMLESMRRIGIRKMRRCFVRGEILGGTGGSWWWNSSVSGSILVLEVDWRWFEEVVSWIVLYGKKWRAGLAVSGKGMSKEGIAWIEGASNGEFWFLMDQVFLGKSSSLITKRLRHPKGRTLGWIDVNEFQIRNCSLVSCKWMAWRYLGWWWNKKTERGEARVQNPSRTHLSMQFMSACGKEAKAKTRSAIFGRNGRDNKLVY